MQKPFFVSIILVFLCLVLLVQAAKPLRQFKSQLGSIVFVGRVLTSSDSIDISKNQNDFFNLFPNSRAPVQNLVSPVAQFDWSGIQIAIQIPKNTLQLGQTNVYAIFTDNGNYYNVFVNGQQTGLFNTTVNNNDYLIASNLNPKIDNTIVVFKRTEALFGIVSFGGIFASPSDSLTKGDSLFVSTPDSDNTIDPELYFSSASTRLIEFLGDSITCGYGDLGQSPCNFSGATEDNYLAWGSVVGRNLGAVVHTESWSGRGLVRNYGSPNITSSQTMPDYFPLTLANDNETDTLWNFSSWVPDAFIVNLGTNDYSTQPWPPASLFESTFVSFLAHVRSVYANPNLPIFMACGPMTTSTVCSYISQVVATETQNKLPTYFVNLQGIQNQPDDFGCNGHPTVKAQQVMAQRTIAVLQKVLNW